MKKLLYTIIALAATVFTVGCQRETRIEEEGTVEASFNIGFAGTQTKAVSDGLTATQLVVGVYDKALGFVQSQSWLPTSADHKNAFSALKATFNTRLVKGHGYDIVFLAVAPDNGFYTIDLENKSLSVAKTGDSNAEKRDAFYAVYSVSKVTDAINESDIVLTRPFAQINVLDIKEDFLAAKEALVNFKKSALTVKAPTKMNLIDGSVSDADTYVLAKAEMSSTTPNFEPYGARGDYWLLTDYILASNTKELADLSFTLYDEADAEIVSYDLTSVPYQRNFRTNIYGGLLTTDGTFVITIDPVYEGSVEFPIEGKVPAVTFANTELSAAGGALTTDVDGTINFKATHPMATVPVTYKSSNVAVGTIDANGLFTAKAAGNTVVTVSFPAVENGVVKSADDTYSSLTVTFTVTVKAAELADAELTVSGAPTAALAAGESFNLTVASKSDGAITVTADPKDAVTVGAPASGVYAVTAAELSADTEVTLTVSQAATTVYNASTKTVKFTVSKKAEVVPPTPEVVTATVAEFLAAEVSSSQKYQLTGKIAQHKGSINTTYGNFDLVDATGTVYVYGLTKEEVALVIEGESFKGNNDKSFSELGLEEGDTVTLIGYRSAYNDEIEVVGAYYVSHVKDTTPKFGATINGETIAAAGGTKTITVTGNVAWTASVTGGATLSATSGEGAGTITVTVPANTSETAEPEYVVKVSTTAEAATKEFSFTIKQNKYVAPSGDETVVEVVIADQGYEDKATPATATSGEVTVTFSVGENTYKNTPTYFATTSPVGVRLYAENTATVEAAGKTITKIVFEASVNGNKSGVKPTPTVDTGTLDDNLVWTGEATSVTLRAAGTAGNISITKVTVTYK